MGRKEAHVRCVSGRERLLLLQCRFVVDGVSAVHPLLRAPGGVVVVVGRPQRRRERRDAWLLVILLHIVGVAARRRRRRRRRRGGANCPGRRRGRRAAVIGVIVLTLCIVVRGGERRRRGRGAAAGSVVGDADAIRAAQEGFEVLLGFSCELVCTQAPPAVACVLTMSSDELFVCVRASRPFAVDSSRCSRACSRRETWEGPEAM